MNILPKERTTPISNEESIKSITLYKMGDKKQFDYIIEHHFRLVYTIAYNYSGVLTNYKFDKPAYDSDDLTSVGIFGLIKAIDSFNPSKKIPFSSYAATCIKNEMRMYSRHLLCTDDKITDSLDVEVSDCESGESITFKDTLVDDKSLEELVESSFNKDIIASVVDCLDEGVEKDIVKLYYGLIDDECCTQCQIAQILGIYQSVVSRSLKKSFKLLKQNLEYEGFQCFEEVREKVM